jgi:hypothetical protein
MHPVNGEKSGIIGNARCAPNAKVGAQAWRSERRDYQWRKAAPISYE